MTGEAHYPFSEVNAPMSLTDACAPPITNARRWTDAALLGTVTDSLPYLLAPKARFECDCG
jgi:hypothetical protein